jgi:hypothetical protein
MKELPELGFKLVTLANAAKDATSEPSPSNLSSFSEGTLLDPMPGASRLDLLSHIGDLAEAINYHCSRCGVCRAERFTSDTRAPLCSAGTTLRLRYREARRVLFDNSRGGSKSMAGERRLERTRVG